MAILALAPGQEGVSVYLAELDAPVDLAALDDEERARAGRFVRESDARRFAAARSCLRALLAEHTGIPAAESRFALNEFGKPSLVYPVCDVEFNVSHSGGLALFALTRGRRVGIDIELARELDDLEAIARRFFAVPEREAIARLPIHERTGAFYRVWTRKEAYIKAIGTGLSTPLDEFAVSIEPERAALVWRAGDPLEPARWHMADVPVPDGFAAALCVARL